MIFNDSVVSQLPNNNACNDDLIKKIGAGCSVAKTALMILPS